METFSKYSIDLTPITFSDQIHDVLCYISF